MSDKKGRTVDDLIRAYQAGVDYDRDDATDILKHLAVSGCMIVSKSNPTIYTMKANAVMPANTSSPKVKNVTKLDAIGKGLVRLDLMTVYERLDFHVWDLMRDRNWRGSNEMVKVVVGICPDIERRLVAARVESLYRGNWFQRRGAGNATVYQMRGDVPMPTAKAALKAVSRSDEDSEVMAEFNQDDVVTPAAKEVSVAPKVHQTPVSISASHRVETPLAPVVQAPVVHEITLEDGVNTSIWKVMSDYEPYTVQDIATLVSITGITYQTVSARMSILNTEGWFNREKIDRDGRQVFASTLKRTIPMPVNESRYTGPQRLDMIKKRDAVPRPTHRPILKSIDPAPTALEIAMKEAALKASEVQVIAPEVKAAPAPVSVPVQAKAPVVVAAPAAVQKPNQPESNEMKTKSTPVAAEQPTAAIAPLVEVSIAIKGMPFTLKEARTLMAEINSLGYSSPATMKDRSSSLIQNNITIREESFTPQELMEVYRSLSAQGIGAAA
jgi:hypothetical protein